MRSFYWLIEGRLAGSGQPGLFNAFEEDVEWLAARGIRVVVTLTEQPLEPPVSGFGLEGLHFPVADMGVPTLPRADAICRAVADALDEDRPVLLHCKAGLGRTGTLLACCLVRLGRSAQEAVVRVRQTNPNFIQTEIQEDFVYHYEESLRSPGKGLPRLRLPGWARGRSS